MPKRTICSLRLITALLLLICNSPARYGANLVIHSATKFIDGQGRVLGGIVAGDHERIADIRTFCRSTGPALSPFNAWLLSKSLETLAVRLDRHCQNALALAEYLQTREEISKVNYPFLPSHPAVDIARKQMNMGGGIVTFELKGGLEAGRNFLNSIKLLSLSANLGDTAQYCYASCIYYPLSGAGRGPLANWYYQWSGAHFCRIRAYR